MSRAWSTFDAIVRVFLAIVNLVDLFNVGFLFLAIANFKWDTRDDAFFKAIDSVAVNEANEFTLDLLISNSIIMIVCLLGLIGVCFAKRTVLVIYDIALILIFSFKFVSIPFTTSPAYDQELNQIIVMNNLSIAFLFVMILAVTYLIQRLRKPIQGEVQEFIKYPIKEPIYFTS